MKPTALPAKPGDRVDVVVDLNRETVRFAGYGVYQGEFPVGEEAAGFFADSIRSEGKPSPLILLDSGERVWGCECWWAPKKTFAATWQAGPNPAGGSSRCPSPKSAGGIAATEGQNGAYKRPAHDK